MPIIPKDTTFSKKDCLMNLLVNKSIDQLGLIINYLSQEEWLLALVDSQKAPHHYPLTNRFIPSLGKNPQKNIIFNDRPP